MLTCSNCLLCDTASRRQGDRRCCFQACQDRCCPQVHRPRVDCVQPDHQGQVEGEVRWREIRPHGFEREEDQSHQKKIDFRAAHQEDCQADQERQLFPPA